MDKKSRLLQLFVIIYNERKHVKLGFKKLQKLFM